MEQPDTAIKDEAGRFSHEEPADMATNLGVEVISPDEAVRDVQQEFRTEPVVEEVINPREMSGDDYDLPWSD
ncbi:hypothetical protein HOL63_03990 [Candidatus Peregrinibacteria bacterium]|jgi:hypothetical protein|nr:hypothetical protein [Candidatus Peregrinibacteria bacterium]MBT5468242.1 hypothetical protein [Candidatus Peregrinibacteria bacterium]MBT7337090.1 hypothetical protein [Candidatus Peregrinibacteria bacterium]